MNKSVIGFWGYPDPKLVKIIKNQYPNSKWVDLDIDFGYPDKEILPKSYCKIIKNIINNAIFLKPIKIVAPIGKYKCDSGWFASRVLKDLGFDCVTCIYEEIEPKREIKVATSNLSLVDKFNTIMNNIIDGIPSIEYPQIKPEFGFWGVPPNDYEILKLFPNSTHIYGWTRCVEAGTPADLELEMFIDKDVPTVFYAQAFCAKTQLAKYLADKYNGLYIDVDDYINNSIKAKIEAFLRLR